MTTPTTGPLSVELPEELLRRLAEYARADGLLMVASDVAYDSRVRSRNIAAEAVAGKLAELLASIATGDLAAALNERAAYYKAFQDAHEGPDATDHKGNQE